MSFFAHSVFWLFEINTILILCVVFLFTYYGLKQTKHLPPGPRGLPLVGNLPGLIFDLYRTRDEPEYLLARMSRQYGDVISLKVGTKLIVVANGCKSIKEAFQNPLITDRPKSGVMEEAALDEGVAVTSGKSWSYQRKFTMSTFRNFGVGRSTFEGNITDETDILLKLFSRNDRKAFNPRGLLSNCIANVICAVVFGKRYDHSDPEFKQLIIILNETFQTIGSGGLVMFVPVMRYISPKHYKEAVTGFSTLVSFVKRIAENHKKVLDKSDMRDILDVFLNEIDVTLQENSDRNTFLHDKALIATATFLFIGGVETSTTTMGWAILYMIMHPEVQVKVQHEIDSVIGRDRLPKWSDRLQLPFTEAVLLEIQRIRTTVPLGVPHFASEDTKLAGYDVPEGSIVVSNIWAVHNDPDIWNEPQEFKPERFLDMEGKIRHRAEFMPFSAGHRVCLGENLARMEIFIFFTHILHSFHLRNPTNGPVSMKGRGGLTFSPENFEIVAEKRE